MPHPSSADTHTQLLSTPVILADQIQTHSQFSQTQVSGLILYIKNSFLEGVPDTCYSAMVVLTKLLKEGFSHTVSQDQCLLKSIIKYFNQLSKELLGELSPQTYLLEKRMVSLLSLVVQIIYENKRCRLPLTRRFMGNLFMINSDLIASSQKKKEISRIFSVMLEYLSSESRILVECELFSKFRIVLLSNFKIVSDVSSLQRLLRALCKTVPSHPLVLKDLVANGVLRAIQKLIRQSDISKILSRLNLQRLPHFDSIRTKRNL